MAYFLGMTLEKIIAAQLHDIGRVTHEDPEYCHMHHCKDAETILRPFGEFLYPPLHGFAKLPLTFCPAYNDLISETSRRTLGIQGQNWSAELKILNRFEGQEFAANLYEIMDMRLIDDTSKVPTVELRKKLGGKDPEYFDQRTFKMMLKKQITRNINFLAQQGLSETELLNYMKESLDASLALLTRVDYAALLENTDPGQTMVC